MFTINIMEDVHSLKYKNKIKKTKSKKKKDKDRSSLESINLNSNEEGYDMVPEAKMKKKKDKSSEEESLYRDIKKKPLVRLRSSEEDDYGDARKNADPEVINYVDVSPRKPSVKSKTKKKHKKKKKTKRKKYSKKKSKRSSKKKKNKYSRKKSKKTKKKTRKNKKKRGVRYMSPSGGGWRPFSKNNDPPRTINPLRAEMTKQQQEDREEDPGKTINPLQTEIMKGQQEDREEEQRRRHRRVMNPAAEHGDSEDGSSNVITNPMDKEGEDDGAEEVEEARAERQHAAAADQLKAEKDTLERLETRAKARVPRLRGQAVAAAAAAAAVEQQRARKSEHRERDPYDRQVIDQMDKINRMVNPMAGLKKTGVDGRTESIKRHVGRVHNRRREVAQRRADDAFRDLESMLGD